jgi:hypothetical protein
VLPSFFDKNDTNHVGRNLKLTISYLSAAIFSRTATYRLRLHGISNSSRSRMCSATATITDAKTAKLAGRSGQSQDWLDAVFARFRRRRAVPNVARRHPDARAASVRMDSSKRTGLGKRGSAPGDRQGVDGESPLR